LKGVPLPLRARARGGDRSPFDGRCGLAFAWSPLPGQNSSMNAYSLDFTNHGVSYSLELLRLP
jgi:hypothetical protein